MTLKEKIKAKQSGIVFYGLTPPKATHTQEEIKTISQKQCERISPLEIDGIVLYDIQDEVSRTDEKRPFPYIETLDPTMYAQEYLSVLNSPVVVYKAVGKYSHENFTNWLKQNEKKDSFSVFVGAASKEQKVQTSMQEAYDMKKIVNPQLCLGGIAIPERHMVKHDEHERVFTKIQNGCEYFITQAVYNLEASKQFLKDYVEKMNDANIDVVPIIFTLTPCGSLKTLEFMKWLGINIPEFLEEKLTHSGDILNESVKLVEEIFYELYKYGKELGVPIGCNVESVAIRKAEIEASIELLNAVNKIMKEN